MRSRWACLGLGIFAVVAGCGARTGLPGEGDDVAGTGAASPSRPTCKLVLGLAPARVFPESSDNSESLQPTFTLTREGDKACLFSLLSAEQQSTFTLHERCISPWTKLDLGPDVLLGPTMTDSHIVPPAEVLVAPGATSGFALLYGNGLPKVFGGNIAPGTTALPSGTIAEQMVPTRLGVSNGEGHLLIHRHAASTEISAARVHPDGSLSGDTDVLCANNGGPPVLAHVGSTDLVALRSAGEVPPDCKAVTATFDSFAVRGVDPSAPLRMIPAKGYVSSFTLTPFGDDHAFLVATISGTPSHLDAIYLDSTGAPQQDSLIATYEGGFGVAAAELGGALLVVEDAPRALGAMDNSGLRALLVDPTTGAVTATLDIPLDSPLIDSPTPPVIIVSPDQHQALLGFWAQPLGTGGRDYVARIDCVGP